MTRLVGTACFVLLAWSLATAESVVVEVSPLPSSPRVRVRVLREGRPAAGVAVSIDDNGRTKLWAGQTDAKGRLSLPKLTDGTHYISAKVHAWEGYLSVQVEHKKGVSNFDVNLARMDGLAGVEGLPVTARIADLQGVVGDPTGAGIPQVKINIYKQGQLNGDPLFELSTDDNGFFSQHLDSGIYVAVFMCRGFQRKVLVFEVSPNGARELNINLDVGHT